MPRRGKRLVGTEYKKFKSAVGTIDFYFVSCLRHFRFVDAFFYQYNVPNGTNTYNSINKLILYNGIKRNKKKQFLNRLKAADLLYADYKNNKELTAFSSLDFENFYEYRFYRTSSRRF